MSPSIKEFIKKQVKDLPLEKQTQFTSATELYEAVPSEKYPTGTKGRIGVFEVMEMTKEIERIILTDPSSLAIFEAARSSGFITFKEDAILKAIQGTITFEEVMKL